MKCAARIILAAAIVAGTAAGQDSAAGIKGGLMLCLAGDQESSSIYNPSNLFSLKAGFFYAHRLSDVVSVQPEIQLAFKGARTYSAVTRHEEAVHFSYLEVPLLVSAQIVPGTLDLFAGPYAAILLGHTPLDKQHDWTWEENKLKGYDLGACIGARAWWRDFLLEIQFTRGFIDVLPFGDRSHFNTTVEFQVGYRLLK